MFWPQGLNAETSRNLFTIAALVIFTLDDNKKIRDDSEKNKRLWGGKTIINQSTSNTYLLFVLITLKKCVVDGHVLGKYFAGHFAVEIKFNNFSFSLFSFSPRKLPTDITATIKCEKTYEICEGCSQKIHDRYYLRVADTNWHEACLTCNICHLLLNYKCHVRNSKLYCKDDYYRWDRLLHHVTFKHTIYNNILCNFWLYQNLRHEM